MPSSFPGMNRVEFRTATSQDLLEIMALDHLTATDSGRVKFIKVSVANGSCFVAKAGEQIAGYAVLTYSFFHFGFVELLYVRESMRRNGVGRALLGKLEEICVTSKLFTSTNESNLPMRHLLSACGFSPSGRVENIDPGDPELIFFKLLERC